jgi:tetratricopeptide (TPR) repeat protein
MKKYTWLCALLISANAALAETTPLDASIEKLQHGWAAANYKTPDGDKEAVFKKLSEEAHKVTADNPGRAEPLIWEAIILGDYAREKGVLIDIKVAEKARDLLFDAEKIDPNALGGSIYTTLGLLHYKVLGWPFGFGDKDKARGYLEKALKIDPEGIDANYIYADFLLVRREHAKALEHFKKALNAPARAGREDADAGRKADIQKGIDDSINWERHHAEK